MKRGLFFALVITLAIGLLSHMFVLAEVKAPPVLVGLSLIVGYLGCVVLLAYSATLMLTPGRAKMRFHLGLYCYGDKAGYLHKRLFRYITHGPQSWAWWHLFSVQRIPLTDVREPSTGHRWWVYTRRGSFYVDVVFDRRKQAYA